MKLKKELDVLLGEADANTLFSNLSSEDELLASLGPVVGIARVAQGKMSATEYLERYGHRGPHEAEMSSPRPAEDSDWLEKQLAQYDASPVDVDELLDQRREAFEVAFEASIRIVDFFAVSAEREPGYLREVAARLDGLHEFKECILTFTPHNEVGVIETLVREKGSVEPSHDDRDTRPSDHVRYSIGVWRRWRERRNAHKVGAHDLGPVKRL